MSECIYSVVNVPECKLSCFFVEHTRTNENTFFAVWKLSRVWLVQIKTILCLYEIYTRKAKTQQTSQLHPGKLFFARKKEGKKKSYTKGLGGGGGGVFEPTTLCSLGERSTNIHLLDTLYAATLAKEADCTKHIILHTHTHCRHTHTLHTMSGEKLQLLNFYTCAPPSTENPLFAHKHKYPICST